MWQLGGLAGCHQKPERSFFYKGKQFPVCARCTGAGIGYVVGGFIYTLVRLPVLANIGLCVIMFMDWLLQYLNIRASTNVRRCITGFLCGFGMMQLFIDVVLFIVEKIIL